MRRKLKIKGHGTCSGTKHKHKHWTLIPMVVLQATSCGYTTQYQIIIIIFFDSQNGLLFLCDLWKKKKKKKNVIRMQMNIEKCSGHGLILFYFLFICFLFVLIIINDFLNIFYLQIEFFFSSQNEIFVIEKYWRWTWIINFHYFATNKIIIIKSIWE